MLVLLKIGGGSISPKDSYGKFVREHCIERLARVIMKFVRRSYKFVIIHGGGGHAHTPVKCYGLLKYVDFSNRIGVSITKLMLYKLKTKILEIFVREGVPVYPLETNDLLKEGNSLDICKLGRVIEAGFVPVLNGEIAITEDGLRIVSGDDIMLYLARDLRPDLCIFLIDKPGILDKDGKTLSTIPRGAMISEVTSRGVADVTGGILRKLDVCYEICNYVKQIYICSIEYPEELEFIIENVGEVAPHCTRILCTE